ncbi:BTB/POZ domain-containing protein [Rhizophagus irregularis DAOM 181602=DAOM 197198]|nr:BTB/POZ domain-containing protein [Rhizophagus irregularis DAOM 181602=DAOM 197198]
MLCRQDIYLTPRLLITTDVALIARTNCSYNYTQEIFLFSLTNRFNPILNRVNFEKEAIIWSKNEGPHFWLQDLYIKSSGSFINNIVGKSKQRSYEKKIINRETFEIEKYEVFQVIDSRLSTFIFS